MGAQSSSFLNVWCGYLLGWLVLFGTGARRVNEVFQIFQVLIGKILQWWANWAAVAALNLQPALDDGDTEAVPAVANIEVGENKVLELLLHCLGVVRADIAVEIQCEIWHEIEHGGRIRAHAHFQEGQRVGFGSR